MKPQIQQYLLTGLLKYTASLHPNAPQNLAGTPTSTSVSLTWTAVSGATSYKVYRDGVSVGSPTTNSFNNTGLTASTEYDYQVSAVNAAGEGTKSAVLTVTTLA
ncbi:fibronectin type III domain-containing protein [Bacillus gobiensis]|uniref:fibronectin type III domain-containing protein n=1 Tax=Bacillus gobiensis TaxID=1441095 RepID=UPI003D21299F